MIFSENSGRLTLSLAAVARQPLLEVGCAVSIDQYTCITENRYAVLTPNSSIPSTASSAPIICQGRCSVSSDAPRVLIESSEKNKASVDESRAPRGGQDEAQIREEMLRGGAVPMSAFGT